MFIIYSNFLGEMNLLSYRKQHKQRSYVKMFYIRITTKMSSFTIELSVGRLRHEGYKILKYKRQPYYVIPGCSRMTELPRSCVNNVHLKGVREALRNRIFIVPQTILSGHTIQGQKWIGSLLIPKRSAKARNTVHDLLLLKKMRFPVK